MDEMTIQPKEENKIEEFIKKRTKEFEDEMAQLRERNVRELSYDLRRRDDSWVNK
jgi:hypothetical protein